MPAAAIIGPDGTILRPRKGRPPKGGYPYPYPTSTDPARTIYIGKNNARHWADLKQRLGYSGDVDFVSFLLRLAEERLRYSLTLDVHQPKGQSCEMRQSFFSLGLTIMVMACNTGRDSGNGLLR
jgi:hypothetical protein